MVFGEHSGFFKLLGIPIFMELSLMSIFLMMSGFLMYYSYAQRDLTSNIVDNAKFAIGKIKKLYPLHVETALIQLVFNIIFYFDIFVGHPEWFAGYSFRVCINLALLQAWFPDRVKYTFFLNGPSWFLSVMLFAYFMFPLILKLIKRLGTIRNNAIAIVVIFAVAYIATIICGLIAGFNVDVTENVNQNDVFLWFTMNSPIMRLTDFMIGCIIGFIYSERRKNKDIDAKAHSKGLWTFLEIMAFVYFLVISVILVYLFFMLGDFGIAFVFCPPGLPCLLGLPVLLVCIYERGYLSKLFTWKPLVYLGDISMYTYLIHYIFTQLWAYMQDYVFGINRTDKINIYIIPYELILTIVISMLYDKLTHYIVKRR